MPVRRLIVLLITALAAFIVAVAPTAAHAETRVKAKTAAGSQTNAAKPRVCWAFVVGAGGRVGMGLFITKDPIGLAGGETNLYRYAAGDPVNRTDPSGLLSFSDVSDFAAGFGDDVTFGGTKAIRGLLGVDNVDYCSGAYTGGGYTGTGIGLATGGAGLVKGAGKLAARNGGGIRGLGRGLADETGSFDPAEFAEAVLRRKKGSIQRAPLPPGSASWDQVRQMTMAEIQAAAKANEPGFKTILKLLQDKRFDR